MRTLGGEAEPLTLTYTDAGGLDVARQELATLRPTAEAGGHVWLGAGFVRPGTLTLELTPAGGGTLAATATTRDVLAHLFTLRPR